MAANWSGSCWPDTADTTATPLTYALRALGRHHELKNQVAAEVTALRDGVLRRTDRIRHMGAP